MPNLIRWPEAEVKSVLSGILTAVGRGFTINIKSNGTACPLCLASGYLDPVTDSSTNSFCPVCYGLYYLNTPTRVSASGHIRWLNSEIPRQYPGGQIPDGDCIITVPFSDEMRTNIERSESFTVDGKNLSLKNYTPKGAHLPNRIIITLKQESDNILSTPSTGDFTVGTSLVGVGTIA